MYKRIHTSRSERIMIKALIVLSILAVAGLTAIVVIEGAI